MKKETNMKRMWIALICTVLFNGATAHGKEQCSNATLNGSYGLFGSGTIIGVGPVALVGVFTFDGKDNMTGTVIQKVNGNNVEVTFTGTYTVDPSCLVSDTVLTSTGQTVTHVSVIVDSSKEFYILNTVPPTATSGNVVVALAEKEFPKAKGK
jgi:hypothetical protein